MNRSRFFSVLPLCGLLLAGTLFTGCFGSDDDDDNNGGNSQLAGVWQNTESQGGQTVGQETIELSSDGTFVTVYADYTFEECASMEGTWSADEDSIRSTMGNVAYTLDGNTLTVLDADDGSEIVYSKISEMVSCDDYGWGSVDQWSGSITASIDGSPLSLGLVYVENEDGVLGFGGTNGTASIGFVVQGGTPGTYTVETAMGTYTPVIMDYMNSWVSSSMSLTLSTSTETHIEGTFSFVGTHITNPLDTKTISGSFNLTR